MGIEFVKVILCKLLDLILFTKVDFTSHCCSLIYQCKLCLYVWPQIVSCFSCKQFLLLFT